MFRILTEDEQIEIQDESEEEIENFLDSLTAEQFDKIVNFVMNLPKLQKEINFECANCKKENNIMVEGLQNFLS